MTTTVNLFNKPERVERVSMYIWWCILHKVEFIILTLTTGQTNTFIRYFFLKVSLDYLREVFKKKSVDFFHTRGRGFWAKSTLFKKCGKKGVFCVFCLFLTLFDRKISGNFPHCRGRGEEGTGGVEKKSTLLFFFFEGFPNISPSPLWFAVSPNWQKMFGATFM